MEGFPETDHAGGMTGDKVCKYGLIRVIIGSGDGFQNLFHHTGAFHRSLGSSSDYYGCSYTSHPAVFCRAFRFAWLSSGSSQYITQSSIRSSTVVTLPCRGIVYCFPEAITPYCPSLDLMPAVPLHTALTPLASS